MKKKHGVTGQKQNASECGERGKMANTGQGITDERTPTMTARTTENCYTQLLAACLPAFRNLSAGIDVRRRPI